MKEIIKLLVIFIMPLLCIWAVNGCYEINEIEKEKVINVNSKSK